MKNTTGKSDIAQFYQGNFRDNPGFALSQAYFALSKTVSKRVKQAGYDLTPHEFSILNFLHEHKSLNQSMIAQLTYRDKPAVTRMLERLIDKGLVKKRLSNKDRRAYKVALTQKGKNLRERVVPIAQSALGEALNNIQLHDIEKMVDKLHQIADNLDLSTN